MTNANSNTQVCVNPKNYRLTQGETYEIIKTEKGYVFVENDNGKIARYDDSLFQDATPARTEQDCINSITASETTVTFRDLNNNQVTVNSSIAGNSENDFSCGILRLSGINTTIATIENTVDTSDNDLILLKRKLLKIAINLFLSNYTTSKGMWIASTNQNTNYEDYFAELNEMSNHNSGWFRNPNSGNQINMWYGIINQ